MFIGAIEELRVFGKENDSIVSSVKDFERFNHPPMTMHPNIKTLTIIACHTDTTLKVKTIINNLKYFRFINNEIIIINSSNTRYSKVLESACHDLGLNYIEISNSKQLDAGKWMHVLKSTDIQPYNFVVFTNDSFFINNPICHFYNKMATRNVELFGYNDSTQITYHYQSYLFGIKRNSINKFISHYESHKKLLTDYMAVVSNIELKLFHIFHTKDCFLKIGDFYNHKGKNIFFNNDALYIKLMRAGLLPFFKLKRITAYRANKQKSTNTMSLSINMNIK
jgi:hypothetical protein